MTTNEDHTQRIVGGVIDRLTTDRSGVPVATRITQALAGAGLLMPDLPTPDTGEISGITDWRVNSWGVSVYPDSNGHPAMIHIENRTRMAKPYVFNSQKAREFGEAMIAAANHAEQENKK